MSDGMKDVLLYFSMKYDGDFMKIFDAVKNKEVFDEKKFRELKKNMKHDFVTIIDDNYPNILKKVDAPPFVLYYEGNLNLVDNPLPNEYGHLENGYRMLSTVFPYIKNGEMRYDYLTACENHDELTKLLEHMKSKGLEFKDYSRKKIKVKER